MGKAEEYLTYDNVRKFHLTPDNITDLIIADGNIEEYLTPAQMNNVYLSSENIIKLIEK